MHEINEFRLSAAFSELGQVTAGVEATPEEKKILGYVDDLIHLVDSQWTVDMVDLMNEGDDPEEERAALVLRDCFYRVFKAGQLVGMEEAASRPAKEVEVTVSLDPEALSGLVQKAINGML